MASGPTAGALEVVVGPAEDGPLAEPGPVEQVPAPPVPLQKVGQAVAAGQAAVAVVEGLVDSAPALPRRRLDRPAGAVRVLAGALAVLVLLDACRRRPARRLPVGRRPQRRPFRPGAMTPTTPV